jgi:hypothetical protein
MNDEDMAYWQMKIEELIDAITELSAELALHRR